MPDKLSPAATRASLSVCPRFLVVNGAHSSWSGLETAKTSTLCVARATLRVEKSGRKLQHRAPRQFAPTRQREAPMEIVERKSVGRLGHVDGRSRRHLGAGLPEAPHDR